MKKNKTSSRGATGPRSFVHSRAAKPIHCAQNVKTVRLRTEFNKSMNNIFLICHILWHFQDGRH